MIIFSVLVLAVMADGYRLVNQSLSSVRIDVFSLMCEQNGVNNSVLEIASADYLECTEVNFGMKTFEREFTEAQYNDSYNELFKKYCAKMPQLKVCYQTLMDAVSPCVGNASELLISTTKNIINQILDFLCEDDGAIMSRFSTEGGPQCLQGKSKDIIACAVNFLKATTYKDINMTASEASNTRIYHDSLSCVLENLETCNNSISSKVFKKIADTIHHSVSKLARELSKNFTTEQLNGTQNVSARSDGDDKFETQCGKNGLNCTTVQTREPTDNATAEQVLRHVNDTQHKPGESVDDKNLKKLCENNEADCKTVQIREPSDNATIEQVSDHVNETQQEPVESEDNKKLKELCENNEADCKTVQTREPTDNATTEKVLAHVTDPHHEPVESEDDKNFKELCENNEADCKIVQTSGLSDEITTEKEIDPVNGSHHESDRSDDDMSNKLQKLCEKNGVYFKAIQAISVQSIACMEDSFGIKMLGRDLEETQNNDSYAKIVKRYCPRAPLLKTCIHTLIYGVSPCFGDDAEDYRTTTMTAYDGVIDYVCQDDGYRMAKFFAEGGLQCLKNKSHDFKTCAENSKNSFLQGWEIIFPVTQINDLDNQLMNCILKSAASCEPAAVKTLESVAEIIRNTYSHETKKKLPEKATRSLVKASGTVVLAFNVDIFV